MADREGGKRSDRKDRSVLLEARFWKLGKLFCGFLNGKKKRKLSSAHFKSRYLL